MFKNKWIYLVKHILQFISYIYCDTKNLSRIKINLISPVLLTHTLIWLIHS